MIRIPQNSTIIGELRCDGATRVDGRIEGEGNIKDVLLISKTCIWVGKITADKIIVEGTVEGHIIARKTLQIASSAKISGRISAPEMYIAKNARLNCEVSVSRNSIPVGILKPVSDKTQEQNPEPGYIDELAKRRGPVQKTA